MFGQVPPAVADDDDVWHQGAASKWPNIDFLADEDDFQVFCKFALTAKPLKSEKCTRTLNANMKGNADSTQRVGTIFSGMEVFHFACEASVLNCLDC